jgi:outer membrane receptor for ferrienterochelin and colicin
MNRIFTRLGFTAAALVAGSGIVAHAQSSSTGVFTGKVTDASGKLLAGAQVILTGPSLQGARTMVTGPDGIYRFPLTPSGNNYSLKVTTPNGGAQATGLGLDPWKSFVQNFTVKSVTSTAAATVEVLATASAVTVDNTTTTDSRTFSAENLQAVPLANRDWSAAAYLAPSVVDGGRGTANPNIGGGTAFENNYIVDGMNVTDPVLGTNNTRVNTLAIETVQVQTGGYEPEYGRATGGVISVVTKTGSNDFHADAEFTFRPKSMIAGATAQASLPFYAGRSAAGDQSTMSFWLGGPIIKDTLWYSLGINVDASKTTASYGQSYFLDPDQAFNNPLTKPSTSSQIGGLTNSGTSYDLNNKNLDLIGKLTYTINTSNTLEFGFTRNRNKTDNNILGMTTQEYASTMVNHQDVDIYSLNWRGVITPSWLIDVRAGYYKRNAYNDLTAQANLPWVGVNSAPYTLSGQMDVSGNLLFPAYANITRANPGLQLGGYLSAGDSEITRKQWSAKGTNFIGDHIVKYGVDYDETEYKSTSGYTGDFYATRSIRVNALTGAPNYFQDTYRFRLGALGTHVQKSTGAPILDANGNPIQVLLNGALLTLDSKTKNMAYFIQDSWQVLPNLMVVAGFRFDSQDLYGGDGQEYLKFKPSDMTAPRLGITWDPFGDGKTKIMGSFGRFYETVPMDLNQRAGSEEGFVTFTSPSSANAYAHDPANFYTVPSISNIFNTSNYNLNTGYNLSRVIGGSKSAIDPAIKPQSIEEISFGVERQVSSLVKLGAKWKYRYYKNVIEDFSPDFGGTYYLGNPGQRGWGLNPSQVVDYDYPGQDVMVPFPKPRRDYREMVLSVDKAKGGDAWALSSTLTFAINEGNFAGLDSPLNGQADPNISSTYDLPVLMRNTYGILPNSPRYNFQTNGTYDLGSGFTIGARYSYRAGTAISALGPDLGFIFGPNNPDYGAVPYYTYGGQFLHEGNYGNNEAMLEPRGSRGTTPDVSRLDLHLEWTSALPMVAKSKVTLFVDIFNVLNQQMALTVNQSKEYQAQVDGVECDNNGVPIVGGGTRTGYVSLPNPRFLQPTSYQAPRSIQLGARFNF